MPKVTKLVLAGLLVAITVVFRQFFAIWLIPSILRVSFSFVPYILAGWLLGPIYAGVVGFFADVLGMLIFPVGGAYFLGYTFSETLTCVIYGLFLCSRSVDRWLFLRLVLSLVVVHLFVQLGLNTLWSSIMTGKAFWVLVPTRVVANVARFPVELALMFALMRFMEKPVNLYLKKISAPPKTETLNSE